MIAVPKAQSAEANREHPSFTVIRAFTVAADSVEIPIAEGRAACQVAAEDVEEPCASAAEAVTTNLEESREQLATEARDRSSLRVAVEKESIL